MNLNEKIALDYKVAFKAQEELRVGTLRLLRADLKNRELEKREELSDQEIVAAVRTQIKRRDEAAEAFEKGGRPEMAARERAEGEVLKAYLPPALSDEELDALVAAAVAEAAARGPSDVGKVMKVLMPKVTGRVDGKLINEKVRRALSA